jgi:hypothetical protein
LTGKFFIMEINGNKLAEAAGPTGQITPHHPPYALVFLIKKYIYSSPTKTMYVLIFTNVGLTNSL